MSATKTVIYEAYFDLWGYKPKDIDTIQEELSDFANVGEEYECYTCPAAMGARFRSQNEKRVDAAIRLYRKIVARMKRYKEIDGYYWTCA